MFCRSGRGNGSFERLIGNIPLSPRDFLQARDFRLLPLLDETDEIGRIEQRLMGPRVEPGDPAPETSYVQFPGFSDTRQSNR